ncbi:MAG: ABC transporter ATP-binding protein [Paraclostridium sp.]
MNKSKYNFFIQFLKPEFNSILIVSILEFITIIISVTIPYFLGLIITSLEQSTATISILMRNFFIVIFLYLLWDLCNIKTEITFSRINKNIQNNLRQFYYKRIFNSNITLVESISEGEIINKLIKDTDKLEKSFFNFFRLCVSIVSIIASIVSMFIINKQLTLILTVFFLILLSIQRIFSKGLTSGYLKYKHSEESLLKNFKNFLSGFMNVKIFSLEEKCISTLNQNNTENIENYIKLNKVSSFYTNISFFVISVFRVSSLAIGGIIYLLYNTITLGGIFTVYSYAIQLTTQLRSIIKLDIIIKDIMTSLDRILIFIDNFEMNDDNLVADFEIHSIEFKNLSFKYVDKYIFKNLNYYFEKNDIIGVVGSNGSGKTTLMKLICGFYKSNKLLFNSLPQQKWTNKEILSRISYVPQNIFLFPSTIMDNISCFDSDNEENVYKVCKDLNIHNKILSLKDGYNTVIDERNSNLSGGEKQIICIARALVKNSDILILDEINSALDKSMELTIIENIKKYYHDKIVFIISHKDKILESCNYSINIDESKV